MDVLYVLLSSGLAVTVIIQIMTVKWVCASYSVDISRWGFLLCCTVSITTFKHKLQQLIHFLCSHSSPLERLHWESRCDWWTCTSPYGEHAYGRQFGNMQPGPADYQLDQRLSRSRGSMSMNLVQSSGETKNRWLEKGVWSVRASATDAGDCDEASQAEVREPFVTVTLILNKT